MSDRLEDDLLAIASAYERAVESAGTGRPLGGVAYQVVRRSWFFEPLAEGKTCSVANFQKLADYFRNPANWPGGVVPKDAGIILRKRGFVPLDRAA